MADFTVHGSLAAVATRSTSGHIVQRKIACLEFDCDATNGLTGTGSFVLIPASENLYGLIILNVWGMVTEIFGGGTEDQGVVTISDESNNSIATWTATNSAADALGDKVDSSLSTEWDNVTSGADLSGQSVAAGEYVDAAVTQQTSGTSVGGKVLVCVEFMQIPSRITEGQ